MHKVRTSNILASVSTVEYLLVVFSVCSGSVLVQVSNPFNGLAMYSYKLYESILVRAQIYCTV